MLPDSLTIPISPRCQHPGCTAAGEPCTQAGTNLETAVRYCGLHAPDHGYCCCCFHSSENIKTMSICSSCFHGEIMELNNKDIQADEPEVEMPEDMYPRDYR
jgi:hypothetical protein